tara:strand:- start:500 stop:1393 length:894 start_codon:yes stop_codon:yes gene_type:complete
VTRKLIKRKLKYNIFKRFEDKILKKLLLNRRASLYAERGFPIAVFSNDGIGIHINVLGIFEKEEIQDFIDLLHSLNIKLHEASIADIGANVGNHTLQFSKHFKKVYSFEPNPRTFELLDSNTNRIDNIQTFNFGCGKEDEILLLKESFHNIGGSSVVFDINTDNLIEIQIKKLDELYNEIEDLQAIKIDVEGMEIDVLKGSERIITNSLPVIGLEQLEEEFKEEFTETAALDWLRERGFKIFTLKMSETHWFVRRIKDLLSIFDGGKLTREIIEYEKLPKGSYGMIYAVHKTLIDNQ